MLIICSECGKEYSDQSPRCIHCGAETAKNRYVSNNVPGVNNQNTHYNQQNNGANVFTVIILLIVLVIVGLFVFKLFDNLLHTFDSYQEDDGFNLFSKKIYKVGEKITTGQYEITVKTVEQNSSVGSGSRTISADGGNTFVCIKLEIKNICGKSIGLISQPSFHLVDSKDVNYYNDFFATLYYKNEIGIDNQPSLDPGVTIYDAEAYKIDKNYYLLNNFNLEIWADEIISVKIK